MNSEYRLLPCPFCGSEAALFEDIRYPDMTMIPWIVYGAMCTNKGCIANQVSKYYRNTDAAMAAWNKRYIGQKEET